MSGFKFDFELDGEPEDELKDVFTTPGSGSSKSAQNAADTASESVHQPSADVPLSELLAALPENISYSPVAIPGTGKTLARRDLFDARFQLIASEGENPPAAQNALDFVDAPSDLVPWVYEGGLKTWECSLDLVEYLQGEMGAEEGAWVRGKAILELGCGTAMPSVFLVSQLFAAVGQSESSKDTHIHLQDYNRSVLELVTLPNLILAWYMSPLAAPHLSAHPPPGDDDPESPSAPDPHAPGDVTLAPALLAAFEASLAQHRIHLRFSAGAWDGLALARRYDAVLTSETIYRPKSLPALLRALRAASLGPRAAETDTALASRAAGLSLEAGAPLCLVAAKVLYFGVGGGVKEFVEAVEGGGLGTVETVWEKNDGVRRRVMRIVWSKS